MTTVRPNRPDVVDEVIDGEAVLINLRLGRYHGLDERATAVWVALGDGSATTSVEQLLAAHGEAAASVLAALAAQELIVSDGPLDGDPSQGGVESFTDLEDLLLTDPIHDVDLDAGWPVQKD